MPLPGQQAWVVHSNQLQLILWNAPLEIDPVDPFDSFAVQMPFKSKELLHYFHQSLDAFDSSSSPKKTNILPFVVHHPDALRNTMLVAGTHYAWIVGDMRAYEPAFLHHKIETIKLLNEWLENPLSDSFTTVMRNIATLCLTECSLGNMAAAETHLDGLMTIMDLHRPLEGNLSAHTGFDEELAYRYLIMTYHSVHGIKGRIHGSETLTNMLSGQKSVDFPKLVSLLHRWHEKDIGCLEERLKAMGLFPFFFGALPPKAKFHDIDGLPMVECLRTLTNLTQPRKRKQVNCDPGWVWMGGSASRLDLAIVDAHIGSLFDTATPRNDSTYQGFVGSWASVTLAAGLYLHSVLHLWNGGEPIEHRLFRRVLTILMRDLERSISELKDPMSSTFWFWKVFVGAYSLERHQLYANDPTVQVLESYFDGFVRSWSQASRTTTWQEAKARLLRIAWYTESNEDEGQRIWERALRLDRDRAGHCCTQ